ncbi:hypothetical protein EMIHUDRAFT_452068 [Emiliania huxleyi CCMP1516]|uniref:Uncharacterized protein n=2 Tax=Emiliania huxleyi TaxID=2903 RepID=A0A0D3IPN0_EMIH1|nr:hypothetical protein EMIHUDRAFT_452068 [Emiliania huxleyi CCMP1516]EOD13215.1 hypothetical protein EMIHUDRAFT_452068 [Emiliania huxleyi CCMP1516]|eukprot:XP_005765644.1 hypothetical protein EMIHUDRAFT_452068 [Emiliania huxleyi CCMP1516]
MGDRGMGGDVGGGGSNVSTAAASPEGGVSFATAGEAAAASGGEGEGFREGCEDDLCTDQILTLIERALADEGGGCELSAGLGEAEGGLLGRSLSASRLLGDASGADFSRDTLFALRDKIAAGTATAATAATATAATATATATVAATSPAATIAAAAAAGASGGATGEGGEGVAKGVVGAPALAGIPFMRSGCSAGLESLEL